LEKIINKIDNKNNFEIKNKMKRVLFLILFMLVSSNSYELSNMILCKNNTKCVCVNSCLNLYQIKNISYCKIDKCYNFIDDKCLPTNKKMLPALLLQSIPFTGVFGSGFGYIHRWDLFVVSSGLLLSFCIFLCCVAIGGFVCSETSDTCIQCYLHGGGCLYSSVIFSWWIYGIIVISNYDILDGNGCKLL